VLLGARNSDVREAALLLDGSLMKVAIRRLESVADRGATELIRGNQRQSELIRGNQELIRPGSHRAQRQQHAAHRTRVGERALAFVEAHAKDDGPLETLGAMDGAERDRVGVVLRDATLLQSREIEGDRCPSRCDPPAIKGNQGQSKAIKFNQVQSSSIKGDRTCSEVRSSKWSIKVNQGQSREIAPAPRTGAQSDRAVREAARGSARHGRRQRPVARTRTAHLVGRPLPLLPPPHLPPVGRMRWASEAAWQPPAPPSPLPPSCRSVRCRCMRRAAAPRAVKCAVKAQSSAQRSAPPPARWQASCVSPRAR
jgi:hypothetical protein